MIVALNMSYTAFAVVVENCDGGREWILMQHLSKLEVSLVHLIRHISVIQDSGDDHDCFTD